MEEHGLDDAYRRWGGQTCRRCLKLLGDAAAAEDATQEVFVRLMRHVGRLTPDGGCLAWIYRVATNYCLNAQREGARARGFHGDGAGECCRAAGRSTELDRALRGAIRSAGHVDVPLPHPRACRTRHDG